MRFMGLWHPTKMSQPTQQHMAEMGALIEEMTKKGVMVLTGGWDPHGPSTIIQNTDGKVTVTDGPYAESKELIAGFAVFEVKSKEEAVEWSKRFIKIAGEGYSEMRQL